MLVEQAELAVLETEQPEDHQVLVVMFLLPEEVALTIPAVLQFLTVEMAGVPLSGFSIGHLQPVTAVRLPVVVVAAGKDLIRAFILPETPNGVEEVVVLVTGPLTAHQAILLLAEVPFMVLVAVAVAGKQTPQPPEDKAVRLGLMLLVEAVL